MDVARALALLELDGSAAHPSAGEIRSAYKKQALIRHPDKNSEREAEATARFQELTEASELLLSVDGAPAVAVEAAAAEAAAAGPTAVSLGLRAMPGPQLEKNDLAGSESELSVLWRCGGCAEPNATCCRLNPRKHSLFSTAVVLD